MSEVNQLRDIDSFLGGSILQDNSYEAKKIKSFLEAYKDVVTSNMLFDAISEDVNARAFTCGGDSCQVK